MLELGLLEGQQRRSQKDPSPAERSLSADRLRSAGEGLFWIFSFQHSSIQGSRLSKYLSNIVAQGHSPSVGEARLVCYHTPALARCMAVR